MERATTRDNPKFWQNEIIASQHQLEEWSRECKVIADRFTLKDNRVQDDDGGSSGQLASSWFNVIKSIEDIRLPALFSREPQPVITRQFQYDDDIVAGIACQVLNRTLISELEMDRLYHKARMAVLDMLLYGRGVLWVRFEQEQSQDEFGNEMTIEQNAPVDYVFRNDFFHTPTAMTWEDVLRRGWVARRVSFTQEEGRERFGEVFDKVPLLNSSQDEFMEDDREEGQERVQEKRADVFEIWENVSKTRIHIAKGCNEFLDRVDDPFGLEQFYPCAVFYGNTQDGTCVPIPDARNYVRIAETMGQVVFRIKTHLDTVRVVGFYDKTDEALASVLNTNEDSVMVGVNGRDMNDLNNKFGMLPTDRITITMRSLIEVLQFFQEELYRITGISDILMGAVDPNEKYGQSMIKQNAATQRLQGMKESITDGLQLIMRHKANLVANLYDPQVIREKSGFAYIKEAKQTAQDDPAVLEELWKEVLQFLENSKLRDFRVRVETDESIFEDQNERKQKLNELLGAVSNVLAQAVPALQAVPPFATPLLEILRMVLKAHDPGFQVSAVFDNAIEEIKLALQPPPPPPPGEEPPPDPAAVAAEAEAGAVSAEAQATVEKSAIETEQAGMRAEQTAVQAQTAAQVAQLKVAEEAEKLKQQQAKTMGEAVKVISLAKRAQEQQKASSE